MPHAAAYGILAVQALFFFLGGIRDNFMTGKVIMPDAVHKSMVAARFPPLLNRDLHAIDVHPTH